MTHHALGRLVDTGAIHRNSRHDYTVVSPEKLLDDDEVD